MITIKYIMENVRAVTFSGQRSSAKTVAKTLHYPEIRSTGFTLKVATTTSAILAAIDLMERSGGR